MSVRLGVGIGPFFISGGGGRRHRCRGEHTRFHHAWYWLLGAPIEAMFWLYARLYLAAWWLLWLTTDAILAEVGKRWALSPRWVPFMDTTCPRWPRKLNVAAKRRRSVPVAVNWHPKPIR